MGVFDTYFAAQQNNQKITEDFLINLGFEKNYWGSPRTWREQGDGCVFWVKSFETRPSGFAKSHEIFYFGNNFTGYVTFFNGRGKDPKNHMLCLDTFGELIIETNNRMDVLIGLDQIIDHIRKKER